MSKQLTGIVTSDKMKKTITVRVSRVTRHPRYGKYVRRWKKYLVHDEEETARVGDEVIIAETRPLSKRKRWKLVGIITRNQ